MTQINAGTRRSAYRAIMIEGIVLPQETSDDQDLIALAIETMRVADGVPDAAIRSRLLEMAEDVLRLARASEVPG